MPPEISIQKAAEILGVSPATVTNWLRSGVLPSLAEDEVRIQEKVGDAKRLLSRANKTARKGYVLPAGYAPGRESGRRISAILEAVRNTGIGIEAALLALAAGIVWRSRSGGDRTDPPGGQAGGRPEGPAGQCCHGPTKEMFASFFADDALMPAGIHHQAIRLIREWYAHFEPNGMADFDGMYEILACPLPRVADPLGAVYLSSIREGVRVGKGIYFTPPSIAEAVAADYGRIPGPVLDPCCGTGQFLVHLALQGKRPEELWGVDRDPLAVRLAAFNLFMVFPEYSGRFRLYSGDFLNLEPSRDLFDYADEYESSAWKKTEFALIVTNPPWGYRFSSREKARIREVFSDLDSTESFSLVISKGLDSLEEQGIASFILPESLLHVRSHRGIRSRILAECEILKTEFLGKPFSGVFTPVIRLDLRKKRSPGNGTTNLVRVVGNGPDYEVPQVFFGTNTDCTFDLRLKSRDRRIIESLYRRSHVTLKGNARWALGIVTGNNRLHLLSEAVAGSEPVISGKDIAPYRLSPPANFIQFHPDRYQQVAAESLYRHPVKLVYRFIASEPVVAVDIHGRLSLNSANILIPEIPGFSPEIVAAFLNSALFRFVYRKRFSSIKVLRNHLEELPLPLPDPKLVSALTRAVQDILAEQGSIDRVDELVFDACEIESRDRQYILGIVGR